MTFYSMNHPLAAMELEVQDGTIRNESGLIVYVDEIARVDAVHRSQLMNGEMTTKFQLELQMVVDTLFDVCGHGIAMLNIIDSTSIAVKVSSSEFDRYGGRLHNRFDSACNTVVKSLCMLEVEDMSEDIRFSSLSAAQGGMRFYAGIPLIDPTSRQAIGTLCLVGNDKCKLNDEQRMTFRILSRQAMLVIDRRTRELSHITSPEPAIIPTSSVIDDATISSINNDNDTIESIISSISHATDPQDDKADSDDIDAASLMKYGLPSDEICVKALTRPSATFNEHRRLAVLMSYGIVVSEREDSMNALVNLAADICQSPISAISLVFPTGNFYKAAVGMPPECHPPRATSFCSHAIRAPSELLISEDCLLDDRFKHNPMVTNAPFLRSYVAAPLVDAESGQALGTICMADVVPRKLTDLQKMSLQLLGKLVMTLFEARRRELNLKQAQADANNNQKLAEAASRRADHAARVKTDFLSRMSHEIRTPMHVVLGVSRLLESTRLNMEQQQYVDMIKSSGQLLLSIVNDILDFSTMEAGHLHIRLAPANLADAVESSLLQSYVSACTKGIALSWFIDPRIPSTLMLDVGRLQQILLNLLSNAIKFTSVGTVHLRVYGHWLDPISVTSETTDDRPSHSSRRMELRFDVHDTGIGISNEQLSLLFQSFSQVRHSSGEYHGTGLGLVISERLVIAMNGDKIRVESELGRGSKFSFRIVCHPPHKELERTLSTSDPAEHSDDTDVLDLFGLSSMQKVQLSRLKCVLIGDEVFTESWSKLLKAYGCEVHCFTTVNAVIKYIRDRAMHHDLQRSSYFALEQALRHICDVFIVDLDANNVEEETVLDLFGALCPVRLLLICSRTHLLNIRSSVETCTSSHAPRSPSTILTSSTADLSSYIHPRDTRSDGVTTKSFVSHNIRSELPKPFTGANFLQSLLALGNEPILSASSVLNQMESSHSSTNSVNPACSVTPELHSSTTAISSTPAKTVKAPSRALVKMSTRCPLRILLAEDNLINQKLMVMLLRKLGYEIQVAVNGRDALQLLEREAARGREHEIECILMDASMDIMDGMEATRIIRDGQMPHRIRPFIIAQTANVTDDYRKRCEESGMDMYMSKPIQLECLMSSLQAAYEAHHNL